ncbi:MAG: PGF-pre-PGF domain-containing protein [ANME-2 cluster archaeon]|nr:PGF-pre-PGF domain-containing protein [ANME-2 cluster archaeon]
MIAYVTPITDSSFVNGGRGMMKASRNIRTKLCSMAVLIVFAAVVLAASTTPALAVPSQQITTCMDLQNISNNLAGDYYLANDIDCSGFDYDSDGKGFMPIGNSSSQFTGTFDGKGYKITNLYINRSSTNFVGLFGRIGSVSEIKDVGLEEVDVNGSSYVGGLVGLNSFRTITNCYSTGSVTGSGSSNIGGLVGYNDGTITNSSSSCSVTGSSNIGGLVGNNYFGTITNSSSTGGVTGYSNIGGLVGNNADMMSNGVITNCYSTGSVSGSSNIGGLVGYNGGDDFMMMGGGGVITNCYSTGSVSGSSNFGGLVGYNDGTITNSYWDNETSGQSSSSGGTEKTTEEMKQQATFVNWNFDNIWGIVENETYPYLLWQEVVEAPSITYFAPPSPVNDMVSIRRTFNVTLNQEVNVSWYLNNSLLFTNMSVTKANYTLHAEFVGENNVSAVVKNANGTDMQTWVWKVRENTPPEVTIDMPTQSKSVRILGGEQFWVNFTYTELYPANYTVTVGNATVVINSTTIPSVVGGTDRTANESFYLNTSAADGWYNVTVEMYDNSSNYNITHQNHSVEKGSYDAAISQPENQTTEPNVNVTYELNITNTGSFAGTFTLAVTNHNGADVTALNETTITDLAIGASQNVTLNVTDASAGTYNVTVNVTSTDSGSEVAETGYIMTTIVGPTLALGNVDNVASDWGRNFDLNHSVTVTNTIANNVNVTYNVSWITDNNNMGTIAKDGMKWHNQSRLNSTVQKITVKVDATSTTGSAINDSETFSINITRRDITITANPGSEQTVGVGDTFWINGSAKDEHNEAFIAKADLIKDGSIVNTTDVMNGNANFSTDESAAGIFNFSIRFYNTTHYDNKSTSNSTVTVRGPILTLDNVNDITRDWGKSFNLNHSVTVTNAAASNVNLTYNVSWILNYDTMGTIAQGGMRWHNQTLSNSTVQNITLRVDATSTTGSAINDTGKFQLNITRRNMEITSQPKPAQTFDPDTTFWINASARDEYGDILIGTAGLIKDGTIIESQDISSGNVNFSRTEPLAGTFNFSIRFYNLTHYNNASTSNSSVTINGPTLAISNITGITRDWGRNFNLNHSVTVANATATKMKVSYNVSWLTECTLGTVNKDATGWGNQTVSNSTVQRITVRVNANSTNTSAVNDTDTFQVNITKRDINITSYPSATQTVNPGKTFWLNATTQGEYAENFIGNATLVRDGIIVGTPKAVTDGNASFNRTESSTGTYKFSIRFYNLTYYFNASTDNSTVSVENPPSSSGGGSSGGIGTSDEPENVDETVVLRIYLQAGESSNYNFNNVVTSVDVTPDKTYGLVAAKIEVLKGRPSSITTDPPAGEIYKYVDVFVGTSGWSKDKFSSSVINFQVPATWFEENNIDPATVTLYRHHDGKWKLLKTTMTGQAGGHYQYSSPTPGFSTFMVLGQVEGSSDGEPAAATAFGTVAEPTPTPETTSDKGIPGFGIMLGIIGVLIAVYSRKK